MRNFVPFLLLLITMSSCLQQDKQVAGPETTAILPDVSTVPLENDQLPGSEAFIANCQTCHTARYIDMQPKFTRKTWEKEVRKMIDVYGAVIDDSTAKIIVDYLVRRQDL